MNKFFNFYNSLCIGANTPAIFSYDPYITAIKEMLVSELRQIVYYIEKLKDLNIDMSEYRDKVIDFISILIVNLDFRRESFFTIVEDLYGNKIKLEEMYINKAKELGLEPELLAKDKRDLSSKDTIIKSLNEQEKSSLNQSLNINENKKTLYSAIINIVLNACNCLIELKEYNTDFDDAKDEVLKLLNSSNFPDLNEDELKEKIYAFSRCNYKIVKLLNKTILEKYGPIEETTIELGQRKGKAILVSGTSYQDLEEILKQSQNKNVNVYTHHEMISAHEYKELKSYKNLKGHFQNEHKSFTIDFAEFPGPIYISRNSIPKNDVIRGQIYTSMKYPPYGFAKIEDNDFSQLIKYAQNSKGFDVDKLTAEIKIGCTKESIDILINSIYEKFNSNIINHIFFLGICDMFNSDTKYLKLFTKECPKNSYIISFANDIKREENFSKINSFYDFTILYYLIEKLSENIKDIENNVTVVLSDCNHSTISHIFNLMHLKIKNIYIGPCCPGIVNPQMIEGLTKIFNIKKITTPQNDLKNIIK